MILDYKIKQIILQSDAKEFLKMLANNIREKLEYTLDVYPKYNDYGYRFASIDNHEIYFENNVVIYVDANICERSYNNELINIYEIDEIVVMVDGEEVELIIDGENLTNILNKKL